MDIDLAEGILDVERLIDGNIEADIGWDLPADPLQVALDIVDHRDRI